MAADEEVTVFEDDDLGDPPAPTTPPDDLTYEELAVIAPDAMDPTTPSPLEVN